LIGSSIDSWCIIYQKEIDSLWSIEAEKRVEEIKLGKVKLIPGDEVFEEIKKKYSK